MEQFERKEFKYFVKYEHLDELRKRFLKYMEYDPYCRDKEGSFYTVRSIYLDTRTLLFYYEKIDSVKIRKKLRIRTYNDSDEYDDTAFLEIKRKHGNRVFKERVRILLSEVPYILNGAYLKPTIEDCSRFEKTSYNRFIYLTKRLKLVPVNLVTYEREALIGLEDSKMRVTFDMNVRSYINPDPDDFFRESDLKEIKESHFVLEIKFDGNLPIWVREIIRDFNLHVQAISKYCRGLDIWQTNVAELESII